MMRIDKKGRMYSLPKPDEAYHGFPVPTHPRILSRMQELCAGMPRYDALLAFFADGDYHHFVTEEEIQNYKGNITKLATARRSAALRECRQLCDDDPEFQQLIEQERLSDA